METCVYEFHINSNLLCNIPHFSKKAKNFKIDCNPVVPPTEYEKYTKRMNEQEKAREAKERFEREAREAREAKDKEETLKMIESGELEIEDSVDVETEADADDFLANFEAKRLKLDSMNSELKKEMEQSEETITNLKDNAKAFENILNEVKTNRINGETSKTNEKINEAQEILGKTVDKFLKTDDLFDKLTVKLNKLIDELDNDEDGNALLQELDKLDAKDILSNAQNEYVEKSKALNDELNKFQEETEESIKILKNELNLNDEKSEKNEDDDDKWKMKVTVLNPNEGLKDKLTTVETNEQLKNLENKIAESLSKSEKLAKKFKTNNIKVKIITFDPSQQNGLKSLGDDESDGLSSLLASLFENDQQYEKLKRLKSNYDFVYGENNNINNDLSINSVDDDHHEADMSYYDEQSDENNKLIIY